MARITKTLQLVEGQDDDLIAWFASLPDGKGQRAIKDVIRKGINCDSGNRGGSNRSSVTPPPDETSGALLKAVNDLPHALSLALIPVLMQIASSPPSYPPPSANYVPAYEPPERAYQIKRPSLEASFERSQALIETAQETTESAEEALQQASDAFVGMFG